MDPTEDEKMQQAGLQPGFTEETRNYQREMFEESLRRNIIVAMDTGSGKTHVAILRINAQLERGDGKLSWFLVPSVSLAEQQFDKLQNALPPVHMQILCGHHGVDKWSNQDIWDEVLGDREGVIVSTHMVLVDALSHGFVSLSRIGLLIFDEAHHCQEGHPANQIMQIFYHPQRLLGCEVPDILGLTASPIMKSNPSLLRTMELNLDAIAITPIIHRSELLGHVNPIKPRVVVYNSGMEQQHSLASSQPASWKDFIRHPPTPEAVKQTHSFLANEPPRQDLVLTSRTDLIGHPQTPEAVKEHHGFRIDTPPRQGSRSTSWKDLIGSPRTPQVVKESHSSRFDEPPRQGPRPTSWKDLIGDPRTSGAVKEPHSLRADEPPRQGPRPTSWKDLIGDPRTPGAVKEPRSFRADEPPRQSSQIGLGSSADLGYSRSQPNRWKSSMPSPSAPALLPEISDLDLGPAFEIPLLEKLLSPPASPPAPPPASPPAPPPAPPVREVPPKSNSASFCIAEDNQVEYIQINSTPLLATVKPEARAQDREVECIVPIDDDIEIINPYTGDVVAAAPRIKHGEIKRNHAQNRFGRDSLGSAIAVYESMDIEDDPFMRSLARGSEWDKRRREKLLQTRDTYCQREMKGLVNKAKYLKEQFGEWAANWFIKEAVNLFWKAYRNEDLLGFEDENGVEDDVIIWTNEEKEYLKQRMGEIYVPDELGAVEDGITDKVAKALGVLMEEYEKELDDFSALLFVEQRAGVAALAKIIQEHPSTRGKIRPGKYVGTSSAVKANKPLFDLMVTKGMKNVLPAFHSREINLVVATAVLEEGIDVRSCHLVIRYDFPQNLKSFIQGRGRARRAGSSYVLMLVAGEAQQKMRRYEELEQEMIKLYSDPTREVEELEEVVPMDEEWTFRIEKTGAILTLASAVSHVYHFCACLPSQQFTDNRPDFRTNNSGPPSVGQWSCEIILPNSIHPEIRRTASKSCTWESESSAKRDAAYQCCIKLYLEGLLDDHLMPLVKADLATSATEHDQKRLPQAEVEVTADVWSSIGQHWAGGELYAHGIDVTLPEGEVISVSMLLPVPIAPVKPLTLYWTNESPVGVTIGPSTPVAHDVNLIQRGKKATYQLFENMFWTRLEKDRDDYPYLFVPAGDENWDMRGTAQVSGLEAYESGQEMGVIRDPATSTAYEFRRWRTDIKPFDIDPEREFDRKGQPIVADQPILECVPLLKRRDFGHKMDRKDQHKQISAASRFRQMIPQLVTVDTLPWRYSRLALLLPCIIDRIAKQLLATDLRNSLLSSVPDLSIALVQQATAASSAREPTNYQRLELLGDSVLKLLASVTLMDEQPLWHEGYLTGAKDKIVSNTASSAAAIEKGLSRWIVTQPFTAQKWVPKYIGSSSSAGKVELSTKTLADVVESLIGASYLSSGYVGAIECCSAFGLNITWLPLETRVGGLLKSAREASLHLPRSLPQKYAVLEELVGYSFKNKSLLLEALTHITFESDGSSMSYQRLEFLGDAVLDMVMVHELYHYPRRELSHMLLHKHKSALVNGNYLAYVCLGVSKDVEHSVPTTNSRNQAEGQFLTTKRRNLPLYMFLRHNHTEIPRADAATYHRYKKLKDRIARGLMTTRTYPWTELLRLDAPKHLSDIIESLIAAIWIDSGGDFAEVKAFLQRLGAMDVLRRILEVDMETNHPTTIFGMAVAHDGRMGVVEYHPSGEKEGSYACAISVNGKEVARVEKCVSKAEARCAVAEKALQVVHEREARGEAPIWLKESEEEEGEEKEEKKEKEAHEKHEYEHIDVAGLGAMNAREIEGGEEPEFYDALEAL